MRAVAIAARGRVGSERPGSASVHTFFHLRYRVRVAIAANGRRQVFGMRNIFGVSMAGEAIEAGMY